MARKIPNPKKTSEQVLEKNIKGKALKPKRELMLIRTGSTLLDLACSGSISGGYSTGKMVNIIGDGSTGKTLVALTMLAEINKSKLFNNHRLIYDDSEVALEFDIAQMFGKSLVKRMEIIRSGHLQNLKSNVIKAVKTSTPFIYVLDSYDSIAPDDELKNLESGSKQGYGQEKPKASGYILRNIVGPLTDTKSFILIISQTRAKIGVMFGPKKTRSGGAALNFYACHEIWLNRKGSIKEKKIEIGNDIIAKVTKNKLTGKKRMVTFPVYEEYGIDDIGSCVDFLVEEGVIKERKNTLISEELELEGVRKKFIKLLEAQDKEFLLKKLVRDSWLEREQSLELGRKRKYQ